jgi:hypothetical protein
MMICHRVLLLLSLIVNADCNFQADDDGRVVEEVDKLLVCLLFGRSCCTAVAVVVVVFDISFSC